MHSNKATASFWQMIRCCWLTWCFRATSVFAAPRFRRRTTSRELGAYYETRACNYLRAHGLITVARNYANRGGEIDLIMRDGVELVFVEVRMRNSNHHGGAAQSVDARKLNKIRRAANSYLSKYSKRPPFRLDLVAFEPGQHNEPHWWRAVPLA